MWEIDVMGKQTTKNRRFFVWEAAMVCNFFSNFSGYSGNIVFELLGFQTANSVHAAGHTLYEAFHLPKWVAV